MPALNFQARFADAVERGEKQQTIRARRKYPIKSGDTLYLYTGMGTKKCRKLGEVRCRSVADVAVTKLGIFEALDCANYAEWVPVPARRQLDVARRDGFRDVTELIDWFEKTHGLPFEGVLIRW